MKNKRENYLNIRKYKHLQLKNLIQRTELNLKILCSHTHSLYSEEHRNMLNETKELFEEISLRLD